MFANIPVAHELSDVLRTVSWIMKLGREIMLDRTEMNSVGWICGFVLRELKKNMKLRELMGSEPVILVISGCTLFAHVEYVLLIE